MRTREKQRFFQRTMDTLDMTQGQIGEELGLNQTQVSRMLSGEREIRDYHILACEGLLHRNNAWPLK